ncbi:MAG: RluA family pseudouridine synthase [bacterium]
MKKKDSRVQVLFEDNDIVIVSKPVGVYSIPDRYDKTAFNLSGYLQKKYNKIFVVHRLDKDTSGVMCFAKNAGAHRELNQQFLEQKVNKIYHIVVAGVLREDELDIDIPISDNPAKKGLAIPSARGKSSLTKLKVIERFRMATFCECDLVSGRHHQIRVHCSAIGFPLLVDEHYGNNTEFFLSSIKRRYKLKKKTEEKPIIDRITMHAYELGFTHPSTKEYISFKCDYPRDFTALLQVLRKYSALPDYSVYKVTE